MKYKVGDYLAGEKTVLLRVVVAFPGALDIYGLYSIKHPQDLQWFTLPELEHEGFELVKPDLHQFHNAVEGDMVLVADETTVRVLARSGSACLLSKQKDHGPMSGMIEIMAAAAGDPEHAEHMHKHNMTTYLANAADDWYDVDFMALMNWKLVRE